MNKHVLFAAAAFLLAAVLVPRLYAEDGAAPIRPSASNPRYWEYKGKTVLLIGGSREDNLFQIPDLREHLDILAACGGNYIRNTMSARDDGNVWPFYQRDDGKYDLERLNDEYFNRLEQCLKWSLERDIIVQIEMWDRFDYARDVWRRNPYRPANNVNYGTNQSGLKNEYPNHPGNNENPFFFTVPALRNNELILKYQRAQVDRLLSISLKYPNVLYCMDNETSGDPAWGAYWSDYIKSAAARKGVEVHTTEMWDDWNLRGNAHRATLDNPEQYSFADISQNNHNSGQKHWDALQWAREYVSQRPRPLNNVKIYGADGGRFGNDRDGTERFWRNLIGGAASVRFHRPDSGIGLNETAQAHIRSARMFVEKFDLVRAQPDVESKLLLQREPDEAYLTTLANGRYAVYFPNGGEVTLDAPEFAGHCLVEWLDIEKREWHTPVSSDRTILTTPGTGHWIAVVQANVNAGRASGRS